MEVGGQNKGLTETRVEQGTVGRDRYLLVLYGMMISGFHAREGSTYYILGALMP